MVDVGVGGRIRQLTSDVRGQSWVRSGAGVTSHWPTTPKIHGSEVRSKSVRLCAEGEFSWPTYAAIFRRSSVLSGEMFCS